LIERKWEAPVNNPTVSVIIPLYNKANSIGRSIRSVLNQTWDNIELLIINDGSTDDFASALAPFLKDPRIRLYAKENGGLGSARNYGVARAQGDYIAFLDADDEFMPEHISEGMKIISSRIDIIYYTRILIDRGGVRHLKPHRGLKYNEDMSEYWSVSFGCISPVCMITDQSTSSRIKWNEERGIPEDFDFALRASNEHVEFIFNGAPAVIVYHEFDDRRLSNSFKCETLKRWARTNRRLFSFRGYVAYLGSTVAIHEQRKVIGFFRFFLAFLSGCFRFKNAIRIFLQIILGRRIYIGISDFLIAKVGADRLLS
jgi:glycosyltransferase involved in cell wall biosynthesis